MNIEFIRKKITLFINPRSYKAILLILFTFCLPLIFGNPIHASSSKLIIPQDQLNKFAPNDIIFYEPCTNGNIASSGTCGNTAKEIYWTVLSKYTDDPIKLAGIVGNLISEGGMNPVAWEVYPSAGSGGVDANSGELKGGWDAYYNGNITLTGVGAFQITSGLDSYLHYVNDNAPALINYFKDTTEYSYNWAYHPECSIDASYQVYGDCLLEKIGATEFSKLVEFEVEYALGDNFKPTTTQEYFDTNFSTPSDAAYWWAQKWEIGQDYQNPSQSRLDNAEQAYDELKDFSCSSLEGGSCSKLGELRTAMWTNASQKDREDFMYTVSQEDHSIAGVEGYMNQALAYNDGNLSSWLDGQCPAFRGGISCRGSHTITNEEQNWINEALDGSNNIKYAVGNATGGSNVGAGKIVCVWDGTKCRTDVDYSQQGGTGVCSVYSPSAEYGECWGLEMAESWAEETSKQCGNSTSTANSSSTNTSNSGNSDNSDSSSSGIKWKDGWMVEGSLEGLVIEDVTNRTDLSESTVNPIGSYTTEDGKPNKILLHSTEGTVGGLATYSPGNMYPAHFTIDLKNKTISQHFSIYQPSMAIAKHDKAGPIQFEIVGFSTPSSSGYSSEWDLNNYSDEDWDYLGKVLVAISAETGIPLTSSVSWADGTSRLSSEEFLKYEGILGHMHAPDNDHTDPGNIWQYVEAAIERQGGGCTAGEFVWYNQCDPRWADAPFGSSTVCAGGCGPASFAMMATEMLGREILPDETAKIAGDGGMYVPGAGSSWDITRYLADYYGFQYEDINVSSTQEAESTITQYLKDGWMIHTSGAGSVPFTSGGHYIGIRGITSDGKWLIADSGHSKDYSEQEWDPSSVVSAGMTISNLRAIKSTSAGSCQNNKDSTCNTNNNNSTIGPGTESDMVIGPIHESSVDVPCDPRTIDLGTRDDAYYNGQKHSIRLCSVPNIPDRDGNGDGHDDGNIHVNSRVSGAFYSMAEEHKKKCGKELIASEGFRTAAEQQYFWDLYQSGQGNLAAQPGYSNHQEGLAVDFDTYTYCDNDSSVVSGGWFNEDFLSQFGLRDGRSFGENWHIEAMEQ